MYAPWQFTAIVDFLDHCQSPLAALIALLDRIDVTEVEHDE
jgi:hypothetical protein